MGIRGPPLTSGDQLSHLWLSVPRLSRSWWRCMEHWGGSWGLERVQAGKDGWAGLGALATLFPIGIADVAGLVRLVLGYRNLRVTPGSACWLRLCFSLENKLQI